MSNGGTAETGPRKNIEVQEISRRYLFCYSLEYFDGAAHDGLVEGGLSGSLGGVA